MTKARQIGSLINQLVDNNFGRIIILMGARQVGKTTLVKNYFDAYKYLSVDDPTQRQGYAKMTSAQWHQCYPQAALDEVQEVPSLVESIQAVYDQYSDTKYLLLGSNQILLLKSVQKSLAGRCVVVDMFPLTLPEIRTDNVDSEHTWAPLSLLQQLVSDPQRPVTFSPSAQSDPDYSQKQQAFDHYKTFGGYPALTASSMTDEERYLWLQNHLCTYLERDVRDLIPMADLKPYARLQRIMAAQTGALLNILALSAFSGISTQKIKNYLECLRLSYQTVSLPAWNRRKIKRFINSPKVHYMDYGIVKTLLEKQTGVTKAEFGSLLVVEIYKQLHNLLINASYYHLRTIEGQEIDLLVELPSGYLAFKIKMARKVNKSDARHLLEVASLLDKPLFYGFLLSNDMNTIYFADNIIGVNAAMFLG